MSSEVKTKASSSSVTVFIAALDDPQQRADSKTLCKLMQSVTGCKPVLWGTAIVGFGAYAYRYASGRSGDWPLVGFSPRKGSFSIYFTDGFDAHAGLLKQLGKHKIGKACLSVKSLQDVDHEVLRNLIAQSVSSVRAKAAG